VTYNFRNGETDSFGTAVDLDLFVTEGKALTLVLTEEVVLTFFWKIRISLD
jgi:hypothetical protein